MHTLKVFDILPILLNILCVYSLLIPPYPIGTAQSETYYFGLTRTKPTSCLVTKTS
ncbi:hypothetical protein BJX68DRAFT_237024 [Aspergillus pseudodeflectus]|uniref:Uncharacterized protein n=1 Tax=Aspergillus pseudodeflectus TaxID=176178 RepID=A0ABR4KE82_9EURO